MRLLVFLMWNCAYLGLDVSADKFYWTMWTRLCLTAWTRCSCISLLFRLCISCWAFVTVRQLCIVLVCKESRMLDRKCTVYTILKLVGHGSSQNRRQYMRTDRSYRLCLHPVVSEHYPSDIAQPPENGDWRPFVFVRRRSIHTLAYFIASRFSQMKNFRILYIFI
jgi:hypothetical protein